jgi:lysozyme
MARARRVSRWWIVVAALAASIGFVAGFALVCGGATAPAIDCDTGPTTPGIDVSYHQERIDWSAVRRAGVRFAFVRVSDGATFPDPRFVENFRGAAAVGVLRGAYQFFRPEESAVAQADLMIAALRRDRGELPPVIDVEDAGGRTPAQVARAVGVWIARVRARVGVEPIVYTGPDFWRTRVGRGADVAAQPLWIAHYTAGCPTVPAPWRAWTFWQFTDAGRVPGIDGLVDLDVFAGTVEELEAFARVRRNREQGT